MFMTNMKLQFFRNRDYDCSIGIDHSDRNGKNLTSISDQSDYLI